MLKIRGQIDIRREFLKNKDLWATHTSASAYNVVRAIKEA